MGVMSRANVNVKDFEGHMPLDYAMNFGHENLAQLLKEAGAYGIFEEDQDVLQSPPSVGSATSPFTLPASPEPGSAPQEDAQFVVNDAPVEEVPEKKKKKKKRASVIANEEAAQMLAEDKLPEDKPAEEKPGKERPAEEKLAEKHQPKKRKRRKRS